tara:strand:+ start:302 stop:487 length:186 start_codon:yes stop_codon:yes gene_type:complete
MIKRKLEQPIVQKLSKGRAILAPSRTALSNSFLFNTISKIMPGNRIVLAFSGYSNMDLKIA